MLPTISDRRGFIVLTSTRVAAVRLYDAGQLGWPASRCSQTLDLDELQGDTEKIHLNHLKKTRDTTRSSDKKERRQRAICLEESSLTRVNWREADEESAVALQIGRRAARDRSRQGTVKTWTTNVEWQLTARSRGLIELHITPVWKWRAAQLCDSS